jgi:predicted dienelactone hydrolase
LQKDTRNMTLTRTLLSLAALTAVSLAALAAPATNSYAQPGPCAVRTLDLEWRDAARNRKIPARIYYPLTNAASPVILFSHGLGGSCTGYEYLGRHWASHGYVSVHLTHLGSDAGLFQQPDPPQALKAAAANLQVALDRPLDVTFALDQLSMMNTSDTPLRSRLIIDRAGVSGHSYGGFTTLASAGQTFVLPRGGTRTYGDPRIRAAIAMSPPAPRRREEVLAQTYASITVPFFTLTGTRDDSPIGETTAAERRVPYDHMSACSNKILVIFQDGDHMVFSGRTRNAALGNQYARIQERVLAGSTAFWDAFLKADPAAKDWLSKGGFREMLGEDDVLEMKSGGKAK